MKKIADIFPPGFQPLRASSQPVSVVMGWEVNYNPPTTKQDAPGARPAAFIFIESALLCDGYMD
ncbi:MAG: hypothetical protein HFG63_07205 [Lachnospiraceae bacterium]|nr:hypothetical protein [Lachnospiraceae bacterium]